MVDEARKGYFRQLIGNVGLPGDRLVINVAEDELNRRIVDREIHAGHRSRYEFRIKWREVLFEMVRFKPDLVIISAGFDAHTRDPLADMDLIEEDYDWATRLVMLACRCCVSTPIMENNIDARFSAAVPCLSILEGGYDLQAISKSAAVHVQALFDEASRHIQDERNAVEEIDTPEPPTSQPLLSVSPPLPPLPTTDDQLLAADTQKSGRPISISVQDTQRFSVYDAVERSA
jgi:hypothetical protein